MLLPNEDLRWAQIIWDYMFRSHKPAHADVILGLGCHDISVADDASQLFLEGVAPCVIFSGNVGRMTAGIFADTEAAIMKARAIELGVPSSAILIEERSTNTGENIRFSQRLLEEKGKAVSSIVLVHKPYMLRRDYATFMRQWHNAESVTIDCWARDITLQDYLQKDRNAARETVSVMVGDLERVMKYPSKGFQIEQDIPLTVIRAFEKLVAKGYVDQLISES